VLYIPGSSPRMTNLYFINRLYINLSGLVHKFGDVLS